MADRFYVPGEWSVSSEQCGRLELVGTEAHHLARVLRAEPGDQIEIFDGQGRSAAAVIDSVKKNLVTLHLTSDVQESPIPFPELILAVAAPKGDRWSWLIEKATELGIDRLIPISTARSIVHPGDQKLQKAEQTVLAACKQSHRDRLMVIDPVCPLDKLEERIHLAASQLYFGSPGCLPGSASISASIAGSSGGFRSLMAVIGPEGGLTSQEERILTDWGATPLSLSPHVLRIETAAIAFASWMGLRRMVEWSNPA